MDSAGDLLIPQSLLFGLTLDPFSYHICPWNFVSPGALRFFKGVSVLPQEWGGLGREGSALIKFTF